MSNNRIAALLGISTKTLYKHFKNKEDLIAQALELFYNQQYESVKALPREESASVILFDIWRNGFEMEFEVNNALFQDLHHYYPELEKKVEETISVRLWKEFVNIMNRGIEEGDFRHDLIPVAVLEGLSVLYLSIVRKGEFNKLQLSRNEILLNTLAFYVRGICTDKGVQILDEHIATFSAV